MSKPFSSIPDAINSIAEGKIIIVADDEDRENEGDFVCAAEKITPDMVNFMITRGRGLVCVPVLQDLFDRLDFRLAVDENTAPLHTAFTVPVDHRTSKSGITAQERAHTIRAIVDPESKPDDFVRPGHVQALLAKPGGVLRRAGHTESAVDLARMAGLTPAGVVCEILDETGNRATRDQLLEMANRENLEIITIEDLIKFRRLSEKLVFRTAESDLPTRFGMARVIAYGVKHESQEPIAIAFGDLTSVEAPLVRLHSSCFTGDLLTSLRCDCGDQLQLAMEMISREKCGVLVYLPQEGRGIGLSAKIKAYALQDQGLDTVEANLALGYKVDTRDYGIGIQLLKDLGLSKIRLLTNNPKKTDAFIYGGFDLEVVDQIPIVPPSNPHNAGYLSTKREKMGHRLPKAASSE